MQFLECLLGTIFFFLLFILFLNLVWDIYSDPFHDDFQLIHLGVLPPNQVFLSLAQTPNAWRGFPPE